MHLLRLNVDVEIFSGFSIDITFNNSKNLSLVTIKRKSSYKIMFITIFNSSSLVFFLSPYFLAPKMF